MAEEQEQSGEGTREELEAAAEATAPEQQSADAESPAEAPSEAPAARSADEAQAAGDEGAAQKTRKRLPRLQRRRRPREKREATVARKPITRLPKPESERGRRQERRGVVVSDAMDKTIVVKVDTIKAHKRYKKVVRRSIKFHAHDPGNQAKVGDVVRIVETRPMSKTKNWRLAEIVEAAK